MSKEETTNAFLESLKVNRGNQSELSELEEEHIRNAFLESLKAEKKKYETSEPKDKKRKTTGGHVK